MRNIGGFPVTKVLHRIYILLTRPEATNTRCSDSNRKVPRQFVSPQLLCRANRMDFNMRVVIGLRGLLLLLLMLPISAFAALGGDLSSIQSDGAHLRASVRTTQAAGYTVHEMQTASGIKVREYLSPSGTVFGVAWEGPAKPDLRQVLGTYFDQFIQAAEQKPRKGHGPLVIELPDLVVVSAGRMRAFSGHAFLPQMLPEGVRAAAVR